MSTCRGGSVINPKDIDHEVLVEASLVPRSFLVGGYVEACVVGYLAMLLLTLTQLLFWY